ncbi:MAG: sulfur carrier protein ThiS [Candidatus Binataceae bacterium]
MSNLPIDIRLNGESYTVDAGTCVTMLIERLKLKRGRVAVEVNRAIVPKAQWQRTVLQPGDAVEVVNFVGGG